MCPTGGRRQSLPQITAGTSSRTINTIQLMSKGVSSASPCEPVTCLVQPRRPGTSRPATTQGQVSSRRRQPPEPRGDGQTPNPLPSRAPPAHPSRPPLPQPGCPQAKQGGRAGAVGVEPYRSHLRGGGYREGAEPCWLATMAVEERPAEEKWRQEPAARDGHPAVPGELESARFGQSKAQRKGSRCPKVATAPSQLPQAVPAAPGWVPG